MTNRSNMVWAAVLVAASLICTLGFACVTPLAGIAAVAVLTMPRRAALMATIAVWLINQAIGFLLLDYPHTAHAYAWGAMLGVATLGAFAVASLIDHAKLHVAWRAMASVLAGFAVFEIALYLASIAALGGMDGYATSIIVRVGLINAASAAVLLLLRQVTFTNRPAAAIPAVHRV